MKLIMKKNKGTILVSIVSLCCYFSINAQVSANKVNETITTTEKNHNRNNIISFGVGFNQVKNDNIYAVSATNFVLDYYKSFYNRNKFELGLNFSGQYFSGKSDPSVKMIPLPYLVQNQKSNEVTALQKIENNGYFLGIGPQFDFYLGKKFIFTTAVPVGYLGINQNDFTAKQTTIINGFAVSDIDRQYDLVRILEARTNGFAVQPKIRLSYMLSKVLGIWIEANYTKGPKIVRKIETLIPEGSPNISDEYHYQQLDLGTYAKTESKSDYKSLGVNFGLVIGLGKSKDNVVDNTDGRNNLQNNDDKNSIELDDKFSPQIQKIIEEQDKTVAKNFEYIKHKTNKTASETCDFVVEKVDIHCKGKDNQGNKKYSVSITYKNLLATGVSSLGHYTSACTANPINGSYLEAITPSTANISILSPSATVKTIIPPLGSQVVTFDLVPLTGFTGLHIKGNSILSGTECGNCDGMISIQLPDCCDACELNPVTAINNSISVIDSNAGTINVLNTVSSPNSIARIQADLVSVKIIPNSSSCNKCNDKVKQQDNFIDTNSMVNTIGWANSGQSLPKPDYPLGASRSLTFNSSVVTGVNIAAGAQIKHTIGVAPVSCCGDTVEIWIRYTVWDKDCKVCDKLVKSTIVRDAPCNTNNDFINPKN